jgi:predicted NBD/HSP70 family sugar kinase
VIGTDQHGISKLDLKRQNRMQVLRILKQNGPTSRIDIAAQLELTRAAVTIITNEMIEQGIIAEVGEYKHTTEKAPRGRKKILIDINQNYKFVVGIIIEEKIVGIGLSTLAGEVLDKRNFNINNSVGYEEIISFIETSQGEIMTYNCLQNDRILGVGLAIFPTMYSRLGISADKKGTDFSNILKDFRKFTKLPIVVDNSVKGTAMANIDFDKDIDADRHNLAFLQFGDSFNFVVTNRHDPIVSYDNRTNFVDNIIINPDAKEAFANSKRRGSVKSEITPLAIIEKAKKLYSKENTPYLYRLTNGNVSEIVLDKILEAYHSGDKLIIKIMDRCNELLAVLINNLIYTTNPQKLVLHNFKLCENQTDFLKEAVKKIGSEEIADNIMLSLVETRNRFLAGSAIAIRELFFNRGGFDRVEVE